MSKELEALYRLATRNNGNRRSNEEVDKDFKIVEKALKDYESIENSNPSEALEDLKELHELAYGNDKTSWKIDEIRMSSHIKQALIQGQKDRKELDEYKALEKELGCPLDVRCKVVVGTKIYDENSNEYEVEYINKDDFVAYDGTCDDNGMDYDYLFNWKEYKTTFWLKEDKSE